MPHVNNPKVPRPPAPEILNQDGKVFIGEPNPNKLSAVKMLYTNEKGKRVCSAFRASGTRLCTTTILKPNGRCRMHGGASLIGAATPQYKTGRYSKALPERLRERYEASLTDEKLREFDDDLSVIDARLNDLFMQLDEGGGGEIMGEIKDAHRSFKHANADNDTQAMREALRRLDDAISRGGQEYGVWNEIRMLQEQRRKIVLADAKRLQMTNQLVSVKNVNILISALLDSVSRNVTDRNTLTAITNDFMRITERAGGSMSGQQKQLAAGN
jgi:hypothetical protein